MRQRNFSRIFKKTEAKEREGIFKIKEKGSSKCMEEFRVVPVPTVRQNWENLKDWDVVASKIMVEGLRLEFLKDPKLTKECPPSLVTGQVQSARLEEFVTPWLKEGIIGREVSSEEGVFSRMFTVPKDGNQGC